MQNATKWSLRAGALLLIGAAIAMSGAGSALADAAFTLVALDPNEPNLVTVRRVRQPVQIQGPERFRADQGLSDTSERSGLYNPGPGNLIVEVVSGLNIGASKRLNMSVVSGHWIPGNNVPPPRFRVVLSVPGESPIHVPTKFFIGPDETLVLETFDGIPPLEGMILFVTGYREP